MIASASSLWELLLQLGAVRLQEMVVAKEYRNLGTMSRQERFPKDEEIQPIILNLLRERGVFVLGAPDPEEARIVEHLKRLNLPFVFARNEGGERVLPHQAKQSDPDWLSRDMDGIRSLNGRREVVVVAVECRYDKDQISRSERKVVLITIDHHDSTDPGYWAPPDQFQRGSSLLQILWLLGVTPNEADLVLGAMDHCPEAAFQGKCPGVDPEDVLLLSCHATVVARYGVLEGVDALIAARVMAEKAKTEAEKIKLTYREKLKEIRETRRTPKGLVVLGSSPGRVIFLLAPEVFDLGSEEGMKDYLWWRLVAHLSAVPLLLVTLRRDGTNGMIFYASQGSVERMMGWLNTQGSVLFGVPLRGYGGADGSLPQPVRNWLERRRTEGRIDRYSALLIE